MGIAMIRPKTIDIIIRGKPLTNSFQEKEHLPSEYMVLIINLSREKISRPNSMPIMTTKNKLSVIMCIANPIDIAVRRAVIKILPPNPDFEAQSLLQVLSKSLSTPAHIHKNSLMMPHFHFNALPSSRRRFTS